MKHLNQQGIFCWVNQMHQEPETKRLQAWQEKTIVQSQQDRFGFQMFKQEQILINITLVADITLVAEGIKSQILIIDRNWPGKRVPW